MAKGKPLAERAALIAQARTLIIRRGVNVFRLLREQRGVLTLVQIRKLSRLLGRSG